MTVEKWVDYSKYQGRVGEDSLRRMRANGVRGVCVGSWHGLDANPYAEANLRDARRLGLKTATYIVVNNRSGILSVQQGKDACGAEWDYLSFVAADVEIRGVTVDILADALFMVETLGGRPCIYTGNWFWNWWKVDLGYAPDFRSWPTWLAYYNGVANLNVPVAWGLGQLVGHQYVGTTHIYGTSVDLNVFDSNWISPPIPEPEPEPEPIPPEEEEEVMGKIADMMKAAGLEIEKELAETSVGPAGPPGSPGESIQGPPGPPGSPGVCTCDGGGGIPSGYKVYTVVSGDNASSIAQRHGMTFAEFKQLNESNGRRPRSGDWNLIYAGEQFLVKA